MHKRDRGERLRPRPLLQTPVIAESEEDFKRAVAFSYGISEKYEIPVIVQVDADLATEAEGRGKREEGGSLTQDLKFEINNSVFNKILVVGPQHRNFATNCTSR